MKISYRSSAWSVITSGILGVIAHAFLMYAVLGRSSGALIQSEYVMMFKWHDGVAMFQFLFLIPLVFAFHGLSLQRDAMSRTTRMIGIISMSFVAFTLLMVFPGVLSNGIYAFPQAIVGGWLIVVSWQLAGLFPRALRWSGIVIGLGLIIFGMFLVGYTLFVDPIHLRIPAASIDEFERIPFTPANIFLHQLIWVGALMGVMPLPVWTILTGIRLLRMELALASAAVPHQQQDVSRPSEHDNS